MTEVVAVISGKGGVGKTLVVSNLAVALTGLGRKVLVIDGNVTGPNLGLHLGVRDLSPVSLNDVLRHETFVTQAVYRHPSGFSLIPASLAELGADMAGFKHLFYELLGDYDFILVDAAAGVGGEVEAAVEAADKILLITSPELPSVANTALAKKLAELHGKPIAGVAVNMVRGERHELKAGDIEDFLRLPIVSRIPEHPRVREAIAMGRPVLEHKPRSASSFEFERLARLLAGEEMPRRGMLERVRGFVEDML